MGTPLVISFLVILAGFARSGEFDDDEFVVEGFDATRKLFSL